MKDLVTAETRRSLLAAEGVHAVGDSIRGGEPVVVVHTEDEARAASVPETAEGTPVVVEVDEMPRTLDRHGDYNRPVEGGNKTAIYTPGGDHINSGTLGFSLTDGSNTYATSANHVWAEDQQSRVGHPVSQPVNSADIMGELSDFVYMGGGETIADLAWAETYADQGADNSIVGIGEHTGQPVEPEVGDPIIYSGGRSGVVHGTVVEVNVTGGVITEPPPEPFNYRDCFAFEPDASRGDSGGAVILDDGEPYTPLGQMFAAGSTRTTAHTMTNVEAVTGLSVVGTGHVPTPPMYQGRPRSDYTYCGSATDLFQEWVSGDMSTHRFKFRTGGGDGTGALTLGQCDDGNGDDGNGDDGNGDDGNGDGGPPMYEGRPRSDYTYCGSERSVFDQWVAGEISTFEFQSLTPSGEGTAALTLGSCTAEASVSPSLLAGAGLLGAYYWYQRRRDT